MDKKIIMFGRPYEYCKNCKNVWDILNLLHARPDNRKRFELEKYNLEDDHSVELLATLGLSEFKAIPIVVFLEDGEIWDHDNAVVIGARDDIFFEMLIREFTRNGS